MNNVILIGRLVAEPQVGSNPSNPAQSYARFRLAVDRRVRKDADPSAQHADFIDCVLFGQSVGSFQQLVHKGTKLAVTGHLSSGSYQNKEGKTVYTTSVGVERWEFVEKSLRRLRHRHRSSMLRPRLQSRSSTLLRRSHSSMHLHRHRSSIHLRRSRSSTPQHLHRSSILLHLHRHHSLLTGL